MQPVWIVPMPAARLVLSLALIAALAGMSACGRKAGLDTPYQAAVDARKAAQDAKQEPLPPEPEKPDNNKPFILDPLL